eukprot:777213-Rhodomonas_salina.3
MTFLVQMYGDRGEKRSNRTTLSRYRLDRECGAKCFDLGYGEIKCKSLLSWYKLCGECGVKCLIWAAAHLNAVLRYRLRLASLVAAYARSVPNIT